MTELERWLDLSAYGLKLKRVTLPSGTRIILIAQGGDAYAEQLKELKMTRKEDTGTWYSTDTAPNPRAWMRKFPKMQMVMIPSSEYEEVHTLGAGSSIPVVEVPVEKLRTLGLNRTSQMIFEDEAGVRFIKQQFNKRTIETETSHYTEQQFLRASNPQMLVGCAEGFLLTIEKHPNEDFAAFDTFLATVGASKEEFSVAVSDAINRKLNNPELTSMSDRFTKAYELRQMLAAANVPVNEEHDTLILARRLIGMDKDLIGETVFSNSTNPTLLKKLLPERGVAIAENARDASFLIDFAESSKAAAETILSRRDGGTTVSIIPVKTTATATKMVETLAQIATIENAAIVTKDAGGPKLIVSSVKGNPEPTFNLREIDNVGDLWSWASVVTTTRSHAIELFKSGLTTDADLTAASAYISKNAQQIPYASASKTGEPTLLVGKEIKEATNQALDRLLSTYTDVDALVAREYGFEKSKLGDYLSPEQIDGLALTVSAQDRGRAVLNADGAGAGKGRWNMANVKREISKGRVCLLLTEGPQNFSDLMRDAKHLDMLDKLNVAILNKGVQVIDESTGQPFKTVDHSAMELALATGNWPEGVNLVVGSFSQFNSSDEQHRRVSWLRSVMSANSGVEVAFLGDEIHNAATLTSNTSANIAEAIDNAVSVYMSSATHAHTTQMSAFYSRLLPEGIDTEELRSMMVRGGETFQEVLTNMLVADGVMFRRERNVMDMEFRQSVDHANIVRNKGTMDQLATIIYEMAKLSGAIDDMVEEHNHRGDNVRDGVEMKKMGIGGPLHLMARLFDAALMAETVGNAAVETLQNGGKPVVLVDNTIHALLEEGLKLHGGRAPDFKDVLLRILSQIGKVTIVREPRGPLIDAVANRPALPAPEVDHDDEDELAMQSQFDGEAAEVVIREDDTDEVAAAQREEVNLAVENADVRTNVRSIQMLIETFPDLPASAIDVVKNTLRRAGYSCGEITGRQLEVGIDNLVRPRSDADRDRVRTKNAFNSGELDAILINSAGSTGIDLHAGYRFKDKRQRHFHILQAPDKIQKEIQAIGRVSRFGEVVKPLIHFHSSGLPYKVRLDSMRNNKLRFASATISGSRETMLLMQGIPDLINEVGDGVVWDYAHKRPDLVARLCLTRKFFPADAEENANQVEELVARIAEGKDDETEYQKGIREQQQMRIDAIRRNNHLANDFLSRLALLPVDYQEKTLRDLGAEYELAIEELNNKGINPLRPRELPGVVHVIGQPRVLQGAADAVAVSAFDGPVHLVNVEIERIADPISSEEVMTAVDDGSSEYSAVRRRVHSVLANRDRHIQPYLPRGAASVEDALLQGNANIHWLVKSMGDLSDAVEALVPGREVDYIIGQDEKVQAIITGIRMNSSAAHLMSSYQITVAVPGETKFLTSNLTSFVQEQPIYHVTDDGKKNGFNVRPGLEGNDYEKIIAKFDDATARKRIPAKLLTTNIFHAVRMATQSRLGQLVSYVDVEGRRHRGVIVNTKNAEKRLERISIRLNSREVIWHALTVAHVECNSADFGSKNSIIITPTGTGEYFLRLPPPPDAGKRRVKPKSPAYQALYEQTEEVGAKLHRIRLRNKDELEAALDVVMDPDWGGVNAFYVSAKHRKLLNIPENENEMEYKIAGGMR